MKWQAKYVLFDFDGTLFDTEADIAATVNHVRRRNRLSPLAATTISGFVGNGVANLIRESFPEFDDEAIPELTEAFNSRYSEHPVMDTTTYEGVAENVHLFRHKVIVSNKQEALVRKILDRFGMTDDFLGVFGGDSYPVRKPEASLLERVGESLGVADLEDAAMVGDGQPDHDFAKNLGIPFVCCNYGFSEVKGDYANMVRIDRFEQIFDHLAT